MSGRGEGKRGGGKHSNMAIVKMGRENHKQEQALIKDLRIDKIIKKDSKKKAD